MIWNFEGAVERVARAIFIPGMVDNVRGRGRAGGPQVDIVKLAGCPAQSITLNKDNPKSAAMKSCGDFSAASRTGPRQAIC